jgi:4-hydroxybutyryl-CoA dehydratase/vinylacetyl-CoA-Delta-isomerase
MNRATQEASSGLLMSGSEYRESLRRYRPLVYVDGRWIESVADAPELQPGINALAVTYDFALDSAKAPLMTARQAQRASPVNRMLHINESAGDLLNKLEAVRLLCQETGCAQRYLAHDALNAIHQVSARIDDARGSSEHRARFAEYLTQVQDQDLALGIAMTDAKGDRSKRPHQQSNPDSYLHIVERNGKGIVISGAKAIVTGAAYMHEFLVMPCRNMGAEDADFAVCCAVPVDADGCHHRLAACRSAGREARTRPAAVFASLRSGDCSRPFRARLRSLGAGVLRRRLGTLGSADLQLRHPPPP